MTRERRLLRACWIFVGLALCVAIPWLSVGLSAGGVLPANGAWLLAVILLGVALALAIEAVRSRRADR